jgi:hypothetical protein
LTDQLSNAGHPEGSGGKAVVARLTATARAADQIYAAQPAALNAVSTADLSTFTAGLGPISDSLRRGGQQLEAGLNTAVGLGDRKTVDAFRTDTVCQRL